MKRGGERGHEGSGNRLDLPPALANVGLVLGLDIAEDKLRPLLVDLTLVVVVRLVRIEDARGPAGEGRDRAWGPGRDVEDLSVVAGGGRAGENAMREGIGMVIAAVRVVRVGRDGGDSPLEAELGGREGNPEERRVGCDKRAKGVSARALTKDRDERGRERTLTADGAEPALCLAPPAGLLPRLLGRVNPDLTRARPSLRRRRRLASDRSCPTCSTLGRLRAAELASSFLAAHHLPARAKLDHPDRALLANDEVPARQEDDVAGRDEADDALVGRVGRLEEVLGLGRGGRVGGGRGLRGRRRRRRQAKDFLELERVVADLWRRESEEVSNVGQIRGRSEENEGPARVPHGGQPWPSSSPS